MQEKDLKNCPIQWRQIMNFKKGHSFYNYKQTIISSNHIKDEDVSKLWEILGRIADDSDNPIYPSEDAEIFIGYYE